MKVVTVSATIVLILKVATVGISSQLFLQDLDEEALTVHFCMLSLLIFISVILNINTHVLTLAVLAILNVFLYKTVPQSI